MSIPPVQIIATGETEQEEAPGTSPLLKVMDQADSHMLKPSALISVIVKGTRAFGSTNDWLG
jgi:hypothetical protein